MTSTMEGTRNAWEDFTMPTNDEIDLANWNTVDFTISGQDVLEALYDDGTYGGNAAPSNLVGLLWIDMEAWGQSCDSVN